MIIRILGAGQFRLDEKHLEGLNMIDNDIVQHVSSGDKAGFRRDLDRLISMVTSLGEPLDPAEILASDVIIPPDDLSFEEAKKVFCGSGLIKD